MYCSNCGKVFTSDIDIDSKILHLGDTFFNEVKEKGIITINPSVIGTIAKIVTCCQSPQLCWDNHTKQTTTKSIFCLTFASDHPLGNHWIEVEATDMNTARKRVFKVFSEKWSFLYPKEDFDSKYFPGGKVGRTLHAD